MEPRSPLRRALPLREGRAHRQLAIHRQSSRTVRATPLRLFGRIVAALLGLTLGVVAFSLLSFWRATHPPRLVSAITPHDLGWPYEELQIMTSDGLRLAAWLVPAQEPSDQAIILLHGYPADKGTLLGWARFLYGRYHLLFLDFRAMGQSEGSYISFGYHERKDVLAAIDTLQRRGFHRIGLVGVSFGAAVALLTLPETSALSAVVADSAWANLDAMGETYYGRTGLLRRLLTELTKLWGRLFYGVIAEEIAPERAVRGVRTPLLLLATRDDPLVRVEHVYRLQTALYGHPAAAVWIRERGGHLQGGGAEEQQRILQFFARYFSGAAE
jgi:pimeloyl-ACP methyl ester carboxylesterase